MTATVTIFVFSPDNFFSPVFEEPSYSGTVNESTAVGFSVVEFTVTDGDLVGPAAEIGRIIMTGNDAQFFEAEKTGARSGVIRTR